MEHWKVLILCWLCLALGFIFGAAWCGLFKADADQSAERQQNEG